MKATKKLIVKTKAYNSCLPVHSPRSVSGSGLSRNSYKAIRPEHTTSTAIRTALTAGSSRKTSAPTRRAAVSQKTTSSIRTIGSTRHHRLLPHVSSVSISTRRVTLCLTQMDYFLLSTSKIYLRDATITLRSTYGRRRRATATDRTGCLPESQSASARPGIAPLCSRRECRADRLIHRSQQGERPARPRPLPAAGFRGTGRWECSGQSAAYHPRGEGFHAGEAHEGGSHVERHPTDRGTRRALRHRGYARGCTPAPPLDGLLVEAHPLCAKQAARS